MTALNYHNLWINYTNGPFGVRCVLAVLKTYAKPNPLFWVWEATKSIYCQFSQFTWSHNLDFPRHSLARREEMMMIALDLFIWAWNNSLGSIPNSLHFPLSLAIKSINMIAISFWGRKVAWDMDKQFKWASNHLTTLTNPLVIRLAQSASQRASLKHWWGMRLLSALDYRLSSDPAQIAAFSFSKLVTDRHLPTETFWDNWARLPCFVWTTHSANGYSTDSVELSASLLDSTVVWQYNKQAWTEAKLPFCERNIFFLSPFTCNISVYFFPSDNKGARRKWAKRAYSYFKPKITPILTSNSLFHLFTFTRHNRLDYINTPTETDSLDHASNMLLNR